MRTNEKRASDIGAMFVELEMPEVTKTKVVGVVVDNYKIEIFKRALIAAGFDNIVVSSFSKQTSLLKVSEVPADKVRDIHRICLKVVTDLNHSN